MKSSCVVLVSLAICFLHPITAVIQLQQTSYEITEDIGLDNFALLVCVFAEEDSSVTITTFADTATAFEDYEPLNEVLSLEAGTDVGCVPVIIYEDEDFEDDELFTVALLDESGSIISEADVAILNDDPNELSIRFVEGTPHVVGTQVTFNLELGPAVEQAMCAVNFRTMTTEVDCSSGFVTVSPRRRGGPHQVVARVLSPEGENPPSIVRDIHLGIRRRCSVNLIDDGVVVNRNAREVTVFFRVTEQDGIEPSEVTFMCTISGPVTVPINSACESPLVLSIMTPGEYILVVTPNNDGGCSTRGIQRAIQIIF